MSDNSPLEIFKLSKTPQTVAFTGTAGTTSALTSRTGVVRVVVTSDAFVAIGQTATTSKGTYMTAGIPEYFRFAPDEVVSAIQVSAGGNLHVTELTK